MIFESSWIFLVIAAFFAGFVDAVAGGGGLIQVPALMGVLPETPTATLFGTNKLSSVFGTGSAAVRYLRRINVPWRLVVPAALAAFVFSFLGAACVAWFPPAMARPLVFVLLLMVIMYTVFQPGLGLVEGRSVVQVRHERLVALGVGAVLGFYDGFFGPGTGSFLIFVWVRIFGMDFLRASVSGKVVNLSTNAAALSFFLPAGHVLWVLGAGMAVANVVGAQVGARAALKGGARWVRIVFLAVVVMLVLKIGLDLFVVR